MVLHVAQIGKSPLPQWKPERGEFGLGCSRLLHLIERIQIECEAMTGDHSVEYEKARICEVAERITRAANFLSTEPSVLAKAAFLVHKSFIHLQHACLPHSNSTNQIIPEEGFIAAVKKSHSAQNLAHITLAMEAVLYPLEALQERVLFAGEST